MYCNVDVKKENVTHSAGDYDSRESNDVFRRRKLFGLDWIVWILM